MSSLVSVLRLLGKSVFESIEHAGRHVWLGARSLLGRSSHLYRALERTPSIHCPSLDASFPPFHPVPPSCAFPCLLMPLCARNAFLLSIFKFFYPRLLSSLPSPALSCLFFLRLTSLLPALGCLPSPPPVLVPHPLSSSYFLLLPLTTLSRSSPSAFRLHLSVAHAPSPSLSRAMYFPHPQDTFCYLTCFCFFEPVAMPVSRCFCKTWTVTWLDSAMRAIVHGHSENRKKRLPRLRAHFCAIMAVTIPPSRHCRRSASSIL